jgi:2-amino-4-hydroxy-6-hydroxymethyldihydropteridine diphosphokinase
MDVVVGLGGNSGNVADAFETARARLADVGTVLAVSSVYRSMPVGRTDQPKFLNAALRCAWPGGAGSLLGACLDLERQAGRVRVAGDRWGPRPLDLDLLIADGLVCRGPRLELPHPRLLERAFALVPAAEVAGGWRHPLDGRSLAELAAACDRTGMEAVAVRW